eukprot:IDg17338t1
MRYQDHRSYVREQDSSQQYCTVRYFSSINALAISNNCSKMHGSKSSYISPTTIKETVAVHGKLYTLSVALLINTPSVVTYRVNMTHSRSPHVLISDARNPPISAGIFFLESLPHFASPGILCDSTRVQAPPPRRQAHHASVQEVAFLAVQRRLQRQ